MQSYEHSNFANVGVVRYPNGDIDCWTVRCVACGGELIDLFDLREEAEADAALHTYAHRNSPERIMWNGHDYVAEVIHLMEVPALQSYCGIPRGEYLWNETYAVPSYSTKYKAFDQVTCRECKAVSDTIQ